MENGMKSWWVEFLGTFTLCFIGQGAICASAMAGGGGLLLIALAHGLALAVMISSLGAISGGHFNPAVTLAFVVTRRQSIGAAVPYWVAQLLGGVIASLLLLQVFPDGILEFTRVGAAMLDPNLTAWGGLIVEMILTFFLVTVVWGTAVDPRHPPIGGFGIGLAVAMGIMMGGPLTGAAMNPARAFGAAIVSNTWAMHGIYWVGPLVGAVAAAFVYERFILASRPAWDPEPKL